MPALARWMRGAGLRVLQVLPLNEMAPGQASPYSAISAMALDPIFISVPDVPGLPRARRRGRARHRGARPAASTRGRAVPWTTGAVQDPQGPGAAVRRSGASCEHEWARRIRTRAQQLRAFIGDAGAGGSTTTRCSARRSTSPAAGRGPNGRPGLRDRERRSASPRSRRESAQEILFRQYLQWIAHDAVADGARAVAAASACPATSRSAWPPTAPTCGPTRTSSRSTDRSARRPTRSARTARTGSCPSIAGT